MPAKNIPTWIPCSIVAHDGYNIQAAVTDLSDTYAWGILVRLP